VIFISYDSEMNDPFTRLVVLYDLRCLKLMHETALPGT